MGADARRGLYDIALAATAYKAANGDYPNRLEDLVPAYITRIPIDPFDNKPLKMKSVPGGLDLYSMGSTKESDYEKGEKKIHFYLGQQAYDTFRVKPSKEKGGRKRK